MIKVKAGILLDTIGPSVVQQLTFKYYIKGFLKMYRMTLIESGIKITYVKIRALIQENYKFYHKTSNYICI